jgi:uncharacterized protein YegL
MTTPSRDATPDLSAFVLNKDPRCPAVLLLDTSESMSVDTSESKSVDTSESKSGPPIAALNNGLREFRRSLLEDELASRRAEPLVVRFGATVEAIGDFGTASTFDPPTLEAGGLTPMAEGIELALDLIEQRTDVYRAARTSAYRPWLFLITDGLPTSRPDDLERARARLVRKVVGKKVAFFAVGVTDDAMPFLTTLCEGGRPPMRLVGMNFQELFEWLSVSLGAVSRSAPTDDSVPLQKPTWGQSWDAA